ncbi:MAG: aminopeptidase P family protein [Cyanobacteriota bacterium]|nr:aminopeptidase P family protein [Cyanobacteriota bacterium]
MTLAPAAVVTPSESALKLTALRRWLDDQGLDGLLVPSSDEHLNEYLPLAHQRRQWLSGFTGSAGDALISGEQAWVTVDARYYEQAEQEVDGSVWTVVKLGLPQQPSLNELVSQLGEGFRLGVDAWTISVAAYRELEHYAELGGVQIIPTGQNSIDQLRQEQGEGIPVVGDQPVYALPPTITGATVAEKLARVRQQMQKQRIAVLAVTKLDQLAWLLNLRGSDIPYNPVFMGYGLVSQERFALFTHRERLAPEVDSVLAAVQGELHPYGDYGLQLAEWGHLGKVGIDPKHTTQGSLTQLTQGGWRDIDHPIESLKAVKNAVELEQMRRANLQASRAKIRTLAWIDQQMQAGIPISEVSVAEQIERFYQGEGGWRGLSFNTIAATGSHSSIVHYGTPDASAILQWGQLFLLDSGSQYEGGTTDDTRTIILGEANSQQQLRYTRVLQAHIQCASQQFPVGTAGVQLDGITRANLWQAGMDYGHGTGHGVGALLNVHEGPQGIHKRATVPLEPGMIVSVEPGFYEPGWGGIRIENLCEVQAVPEQAGWLRFVPLTWIPFDKRLVAENLLTGNQKTWLKAYHQAVYENHAAHLDTASLVWLQEACQDW